MRIAQRILAWSRHAEAPKERDLFVIANLHFGGSRTEAVHTHGDHRDPVALHNAGARQRGFGRSELKGDRGWVHSCDHCARGPGAVRAHKDRRCFGRRATAFVASVARYHSQIAKRLRSGPRLADTDPRVHLVALSSRGPARLLGVVELQNFSVRRVERSHAICRASTGSEAARRTVGVAEAEWCREVGVRVARSEPRPCVAIYRHPKAVIDRVRACDIAAHTPEPGKVLVRVHAHDVRLRVTGVLVLFHHERAQALLCRDCKRSCPRLRPVVNIEGPNKLSVSGPDAIVTAASDQLHVTLVGIKPTHHVLVGRAEVRLALAHDVTVVAVLRVAIRTLELRVHETKHVTELVAIRARGRRAECRAVEPNERTRSGSHGTMAAGDVRELNAEHVEVRVRRVAPVVPGLCHGIVHDIPEAHPRTGRTPVVEVGGSISAGMRLPQSDAHVSPFELELPV